MLAAGSRTKVSTAAPATAHSAQNREMRRPGIRRAGSRVCAHARLTSPGAAAVSSSSGGESSGWWSAVRIRRPSGPSRKAANCRASSGSGALAGMVNA